MDHTQGWGLNAKRTNHLINELEFLVPPFDLWGGEMEGSCKVLLGRRLFSRWFEGFIFKGCAVHGGCAELSDLPHPTLGKQRGYLIGFKWVVATGSYGQGMEA